LEAVCRTYREFQIIHRAQQHGVDLRLDAARSFVGFVGTFQGGEHRQLVHQDAGSLTHSFFGRHHTVGFDIEHELVEVGTLFNTSAFNRVAHATHRAVRSVEHDAANGVGAVISQGANVAGHVAAALF